MQVAVEHVHPPPRAKHQHDFSDISDRYCFEQFPQDSEGKLEWKIRPARDNMSPVRQRDDTLKKKLVKEPEKSIGSVATPFTRGVIRTPSAGISITTCGHSSAGGITPISHLPSCSGSPATGPGLSTEHSSICSWRYDDFERANTQRVCLLFNSVDELLYEGKVSSRSESLQDECQEWNSRTPHLRILGEQLEPPKQEGVEYIRREESSARTSFVPLASYLAKRENHSELYVTGHGLAPGFWCEQSILNLSSPLSERSEEVYDAEHVILNEMGILKHLCHCIDCRADEEVNQRTPRALKSGIPPVSPHACIRDEVADELFDDVWKEVVGLLEELLHKYCEKNLPGVSAVLFVLKSTVNESLSSPPLSAIQNHRLPQIHSESPEQEYCVPASRLLQHRGRILRGGATSTMNPINILPPLREPSLLLESLSRPNTTHTFRSDTPMKRSFTPLDFACNMRTSRGLLKGDSTPMGVTGFSMSITSSTASGFLECSTPSKRLLPISSCTDGEGGNMRLLSSIGGQNPRKQLSRFPVHVRKKFQPVMP
ncbi:Protein FAM149A [Triplophysa tibetana]|uniref:Protein FAM149A n=1 Tax=Triplophysa tibetana TaxID=1572043 RepID=A0A5A9NM99_9TELE|nr:Protein FAM149A [Triplophysa tibetana]